MEKIKFQYKFNDEEFIVFPLDPLGRGKLIGLSDNHNWEYTIVPTSLGPYGLKYNELDYERVVNYIKFWEVDLSEDNE